MRYAGLPGYNLSKTSRPTSGQMADSCDSPIRTRRQTSRQTWPDVADRFGTHPDRIILSRIEDPRPHRPQSYKLIMRQLNGGQAPKLGGANNSPTVTILQLGVGVKSEYQGISECLILCIRSNWSAKLRVQVPEDL